LDFGYTSILINKLTKTEKIAFYSSSRVLAEGGPSCEAGKKMELCMHSVSFSTAHSQILTQKGEIIDETGAQSR
jgi:hypothetical protein